MHTPSAVVEAFIRDPGPIPSITNLSLANRIHAGPSSTHSGGTDESSQTILPQGSRAAHVSLSIMNLKSICVTASYLAIAVIGGRNADFKNRNYCYDSIVVLLTAL